MPRCRPARRVLFPPWGGRGRSSVLTHLHAAPPQPAPPVGLGWGLRGVQLEENGFLWAAVATSWRQSGAPVRQASQPVSGATPGGVSSWGWAELGTPGVRLANQLCLLQHKWESARASPSASGMGPTPSPKSSSMCLGRSDSPGSLLLKGMRGLLLSRGPLQDPWEAP